MDSKEKLGMTFTEELNASKIEADKKLLRTIGMLFFVGLSVYLGILNASLYARAFVAPGTANFIHGGPFTVQQLFALLPAIGISGSVIALTFSGIKWFSFGTQAKVGQWAGYGLFAIEAANGIAEWMLSNNAITASDDAIRIYGQYGVPVVVVLVVLIWKLIIDSDEQSEITKEHNETAAIMRVRIREQRAAALDSDGNLTAIRLAGVAQAKRLTAAHTGQIVDHDAVAEDAPDPALQLAAETPAGAVVDDSVTLTREDYDKLVRAAGARKKADTVVLGGDESDPL